MIRKENLFPYLSKKYLLLLARADYWCPAEWSVITSVMNDTIVSAWLRTSTLSLQEQEVLQKQEDFSCKKSLLLQDQEAFHCKKKNKKFFTARTASNSMQIIMFYKSHLFFSHPYSTLASLLYLHSPFINTSKYHHCKCITLWAKSHASVIFSLDCILISFLLLYLFLTVPNIKIDCLCDVTERCKGLLYVRNRFIQMTTTTSSSRVERFIYNETVRLCDYMHNTMMIHIIV